jgi:hypothetical protein
MYGDLETYDELWYSVEPKPWIDPEYGDYDEDEEYEDRRFVSIRIR